MLELWINPNERDVCLKELKIKKALSAYPMKAKKKNGEPIELELSGRILEDENGAFLRFDGIIRDVTERIRMLEELRFMSIRDDLTGLYNRRGFLTLASQQLKMADRREKGIFMLYADLDGLKEINDGLGHDLGDEALRNAALILKETFRNSDIMGRIGGDEFVVIPIEAETYAMSARLQKNIDTQNRKIDGKYKLSLSVGVAYYDPEHPVTLGELLSKADALMYEQKKNARKS